MSSSPRYAGRALSALALLLLAGCTASAAGEDVFADGLAAQDLAPSEQLSTRAHEACEQFEQGTDPQAVAVVFAMQNGLPLDRAEEVLAAGVQAFCPEQQAALDAGG